MTYSIIKENYNKELKTRDPYFDILKCIAIFMVVLQHAFYYIDQGNYENCSINQVISRIDVPIFMMTCGFFTFSSKWNIQKLNKRIFSLLIPFLIWSYIYYIYDNPYNFYKLKDFFVVLIKDPYFCSPLWFFRTLIIETVITYICLKISKKYCVVLMMAFLLVINIIGYYITKDFAIQSLSINYLYFIIGYIINKYNLIGKGISNTFTIFIISLFLFLNILLFCHLNESGGANYIILLEC